MTKLSFRGHADFAPVLAMAKQAACYELGPHWKLVPGASVLARLPAAWVSCKIGVLPTANRKAGRALRIAKSPRDVRLPAACFWPAETLPVGPEYFDDYARDSGSEPLAPRNENDNFVWWHDQPQIAEAAD